MTPICVRCERPTEDGYACSACTGRAAGHLAEVSDLAVDARAVASGEVRRGGGGATGKPGSRPPLNLGVLERLDDVTNDLQGYVRLASEDRGPEIVSAALGDRTVPDPLAWAAVALSGQLEWVRHQPFADEALNAIAQAARKVSGIVNGRIPGRYAGPCSAELESGVCGEDVEARPGARYGRCKTCGAEYDVDEQQAWMRSEIEGYLARPVEIAGVLLRLGFPVGYSTIAAYAAKGQIVAHGTDQLGRPLFRIGDVMTLRMGAKQR